MGRGVGPGDGLDVRKAVGTDVGTLVGRGVGPAVGLDVRRSVGTKVGSEV